MTNLIDLRCTGIRQTGPKRGAACRYLLARISPDLAGVIETKCPRCNHLRQWALGGIRFETAWST